MPCYSSWDDVDASLTASPRSLPMKHVKVIGPILLACAFMLAMTWGTLAYLITRSRQSEIDTAYRNAAYTSHVFGEQVIRTVRSIDGLLSFVAFELQQDASPSRLKELADAGLMPTDVLVQVAFVDVQGRTVSTQAGPDPNRTDLADREHIRVQLDRKVSGLFISKPVLGRVSQKWSIQLTRRVEDAKGQTIGVLVASLDPFYFQRFWTGVASGEHQSVELIGADGVLRTRSLDLQNTLKLGADRSDIAARAARAPFGSFIDRAPDGIDRLSHFVKLDDLPLIVVSGYPRPELLAHVAQQTKKLVLLGSIVTLMLSVLAAWLSMSALRLRAHEAAATSARQRLSDAVDAISEGFILVDADDRIVIVNKALRRLFPDTAEIMTYGMTFEQLVRAIVETGDVVGARGDRSESWIETRLARHRAPAEPFELRLSGNRVIRVTERRTAEGGIVAIYSDITELMSRQDALIRSRETVLQQAEEMRRLAEYAQRSNNAKSAFLAAMSHEIRTPLHAIVGFAGLLARTPLTDEQARWTKTIDGSAKHLTSLVNDVLDFSRLETGYLSLDIAPFGLRDLVCGLAEVTRALLGDKPIEVTTSIDDDLPDSLLGDAGRLNQILLNLLGNAVKFTPAGRIALSVARTAREGAGVGLRFEVSDTGMGIGPAARGNIFKPFEQGELYGKLRAAGAGLGLSIAKKLVDLMGGQIGFDSTQGEGSRFWFEVALEPVKSRLRSAPAKDVGESSADGRALDILIAEDTDSSRMLLQLVLAGRGHRVTETTNGLEALEAARDKDFDLVLLDLQMPVMNGLDAAKAIRDLPGARGRVPVYALTAQAFEEDRRRAERIGVDGVLAKPFAPGELEDLLARIAAGAGELV